MAPLRYSYERATPRQSTPRLSIPDSSCSRKVIPKSPRRCQPELLAHGCNNELAKCANEVTELNRLRRAIRKQETTLSYDGWTFQQAHDAMVDDIRGCIMRGFGCLERVWDATTQLKRNKINTGESDEIHRRFRRMLSRLSQSISSLPFDTYRPTVLTDRRALPRNTVTVLQRIADHRAAMCTAGERRARKSGLEFWEKMRKTLGDKEVDDDYLRSILNLKHRYQSSDQVTPDIELTILIREYTLSKAVDITTAVEHGGGLRAHYNNRYILSTDSSERARWLALADQVCRELGLESEDFGKELMCTRYNAFKLQTIPAILASDMLVTPPNKKRRIMLGEEEPNQKTNSKQSFSPMSGEVRDLMIQRGAGAEVRQTMPRSLTDSPVGPLKDYIDTLEGIRSQIEGDGLKRKPVDRGAPGRRSTLAANVITSRTKGPLTSTSSPAPATKTPARTTGAATTGATTAPAATTAATTATTAAAAATTTTATAAPAANSPPRKRLKRPSPTAPVSLIHDWLHDPAALTRKLENDYDHTLTVYSAVADIEGFLATRVQGVKVPSASKLLPKSTSTVVPQAGRRQPNVLNRPGKRPATTQPTSSTPKSPSTAAPTAAPSQPVSNTPGQTRQPTAGISSITPILTPAAAIAARSSRAITSAPRSTTTPGPPPLTQGLKPTLPTPSSTGNKPLRQITRRSSPRLPAKVVSPPRHQDDNLTDADWLRLATQVPFFDGEVTADGSRVYKV